MKTNDFCNNIDKTFDKFTPYTGLSTVTGISRAIYGIVELICGLAQSIFTKNNEDGQYGVQHMFHGGGNVIKGIIEAIPFVNLLVWWYNNDGHPLTRDDIPFQGAGPFNREVRKMA